MTLQELSQLRDLHREIRIDSERLSYLDASLYSTYRLRELKPPETDMRVASIRKIILEKRSRCIAERERIERYIASVDDSLIRMALTLRFVDEMGWRAVAMRIGGGNTEDSVKKMVYRYLNGQKKEKRAR